jgi:hypothetical protein
MPGAGASTHHAGLEMGLSGNGLPESRQLTRMKRDICGRYQTIYGIEPSFI